ALDVVVGAHIVEALGQRRNLIRQRHLLLIERLRAGVGLHIAQLRHRAAQAKAQKRRRQHKTPEARPHTKPPPHWPRPPSFEPSVNDPKTSTQYPPFPLSKYDLNKTIFG